MLFLVKLTAWRTSSESGFRRCGSLMRVLLNRLNASRRKRLGVVRDFGAVFPSTHPH
jgi:hypothetical protein